MSEKVLLAKSNKQPLSLHLCAVARVTELAILEVTRELELPEKEKIRLSRIGYEAGLLHDLGKYLPKIQNIFDPKKVIAEKDPEDIDLHSLKEGPRSAERDAYRALAIHQDISFLIASAASCEWLQGKLCEGNNWINYKDYGSILDHRMALSAVYHTHPGHVKWSNLDDFLRKFEKETKIFDREKLEGLVELFKKIIEKSKELHGDYFCKKYDPDSIKEALDTALLQETSKPSFVDTLHITSSVSRLRDGLKEIYIKSEKIRSGLLSGGENYTRSKELINEYVGTGHALLNQDAALLEKAGGECVPGSAINSQTKFNAEFIFVRSILSMADELVSCFPGDSGANLSKAKSFSEITAMLDSLDLDVALKSRALLVARALSGGQKTEGSLKEKLGVVCGLNPGERTDGQGEFVGGIQIKDAKGGGLYSLQAAAGDGKGRICLRLLESFDNVKGVVFVCPKIEVADEVYCTLTDTSGIGKAELKTMLRTGSDVRYSWAGGSSQEEPEIIVTTIDQLINIMCTKKRKLVAEEMRSWAFVFDESQEIQDNPSWLLLTGAFIKYRKMFSRAPTLIMTATNYGGWLLASGVSNDPNEIRVYDKKPFFAESKFGLHLGSFDVNLKAEELLAQGSEGVAVIQNSSRHTALSAIRRFKKNGPDFFLLTGKLASKDRVNARNAIRDRFGVDRFTSRWWPNKEPSKLNKKIVYSSSVMGCSLNFSFEHMITDLCGPDQIFQRKGRNDRNAYFSKNGGTPSFYINIEKNTDSSTKGGRFVGKTAKAFVDFLTKKGLGDGKSLALIDFYELYNEFSRKRSELMADEFSAGLKKSIRQSAFSRFRSGSRFSEQLEGSPRLPESPFRDKSVYIIPKLIKLIRGSDGSFSQKELGPQESYDYFTRNDNHITAQYFDNGTEICSSTGGGCSIFRNGDIEAVEVEDARYAASNSDTPLNMHGSAVKYITAQGKKVSYEYVYVVLVNECDGEEIPVGLIKYSESEKIIINAYLNQKNSAEEVNQLPEFEDSEENREDE